MQYVSDFSFISVVTNAVQEKLVFCYFLQHATAGYPAREAMRVVAKVVGNIVVGGGGVRSP
jgi:hypothetical protein